MEVKEEEGGRIRDLEFTWNTNYNGGRRGEGCRIGDLEFNWGHLFNLYSCFSLKHMHLI